MKSNSAFTFFYTALSIIEIASELSNSTVGVYLTKPLLAISLIGYVVFAAFESNNRLNYKLIIALAFALSGDIFLMVRGSDLFIPGLASFLIMQWQYIFIFKEQTRTKLISAFALLRLIPFLFFATVLFFIISPQLTDAIIQTAVGIYAVSIALMAWAALLRRNQVSFSSFRLVFAGAILFMISDSLIAIGRFVTHFPFEAFWVMGTYSAAQLMITMGLLKTRQAGLHQPV